MGRFERVIAALEALPDERREEVITALEDMISDVERPSLLSDAQQADLQRRLDAPDDFASDDEVEAFFSSLKG